HLFSEIIKIKNSAEETSFVPENIGGTLLDHKTIFISNSSPLENKSISKTTFEVRIIEELYKLFSSDNSLPKSDSANLISSLNKITTDKNQFLNSIQVLIKNILNTTNNLSNEVEIRYVSKNLIETKKVNEENLIQFTEYLSKLIEGNQSFSFVIGANSKQILFDVENLAVTAEEKSNTQTESIIKNSTVQDSVSIEAVHTNEPIESIANSKIKYSVDGLQPERHLTEDKSEKNLKASMTKQIENEKPISPENDQQLKKFSSPVNEKNSMTTEVQIEKLDLHQLPNSDSKTFKDDFFILKSSEQEIRNPIEILPQNNSSAKYENSVNKNLYSTLNAEKKIFTTLSSNSKSSENEIKIEIDGELLSHKSDQTLKTEKPEFKFDGIGEVKIVIKEKSSLSIPSNENRIVLENSTRETFIPENQPKRLNHNFELQNFRAEKVNPEIKQPLNNKQELSEKDLPKVINTQSNEPKISRAGLPLIADYQDWDLVFEKSSIEVNNNFKKDITFESNTSANQPDDQIQIPESADLKQPKEFKKTSESSLKVEWEKTTDKKETNSSEDVKQFNEFSEPKEKLLHLKFSGEKKIVAVTDTAKEKVILSAEEVKTKTFIEQKNVTDEKTAVSINSNKFAHEKNSVDYKSSVVNEIRIQSNESMNNKSFENQNQNKSETKQNDINSNQINEEKNIPYEKSSESEFISSNKQFIQPEIKTHLLNSKTIIEHFIKNPVESRTLEKFLQILDKQEIIQRSEIVSYSKQSHSVEIKLSPEELGSIKILLDTNDNNVSAKIEVGNEHTKAIVVNNLSQLKESLNQQGINLNNVNVTVSSEEQRNPEQTKQKSKKKSQNVNSEVEITEEKKTVRNLGYNTYEYL
ncbi:MAG: flagellar hook-length control protein FliK, partial [Ignavibacterium sp.]